MTKQVLLIGLFLSLILSNANGQITFGLNSGLNLTTLHNETIKDDRWDSGIGYRIGGSSEMAFKKFGFRLEADYSFVSIKGTWDDKVSLHYISLPVTIFIRPLKWIKLFVGPEINFLINQSGPKLHLTFGDEEFEKVDYGVHCEIEFKATERLGISIKNYFGLQYNGTIPANPYQNETGLDRLNILGVGLNYYLTK